MHLASSQPEVRLLPFGIPSETRSDMRSWTTETTQTRVLFRLDLPFRNGRCMSHILICLTSSHHVPNIDWKWSSQTFGSWNHSGEFEDKGAGQDWHSFFWDDQWLAVAEKIPLPVADVADMMIQPRCFFTDYFCLHPKQLQQLSFCAGFVHVGIPFGSWKALPSWELLAAMALVALHP